MSVRTIISYDGTANDRDALALGRALGDRGASLVLAYVRHTAETGDARELLAQDDAARLLEDGARWLNAPDTPRHVVLSGSTAQGLRDLAEREGAEIVVFGSDAHTAPGHVAAGTSAQRLLHGAPVAVAIAPARLRDREVLNLERVAIVGGDSDPVARDTAQALAGVGAENLATPAADPLDLLVLGSRPGTVDGTVGLSAASDYLLETARSPVLVLRRGVPITFDRMLAAAS